MNGGAFLNLQKDSKLAVYREHSTADEMKNDENKLGEIKITTVRVTESVVTFTSKPEPEGFIFYAVLTERQLPSVSFYLEGDDKVLEQVKALLKDSTFVAIESDRHKTHHYRLYADNQQFRITDAFERLLVEPIEGYDVNLAVKQVEHIARWRKTREMENPSTTIPKNAIEIEIFHNGKRLKDSHPRLDYQYKDSTWKEPTIRLKLKNTFHRSLYCTILDIADDYSVSFPGILPEGGDRSWIKLEPGQEYWAAPEESDGHEPQDIPLAIPDEVLKQGVTEYQDLFKLVASTTQFNSSDFLQGSLLVAQPPDRQVARRQTLPNDDWMTKQFSFTYVRPKDSVKLTPETETALSFGIAIKAPSGLSASARFKTTKSATRSMSSTALPSLLKETEAFQFTITSRSLEQGLDVLELEVDSSTINAVKPDSPMIISVDRSLQPNERILAVAHDGQFYFPLGIGQAENGKIEIKIEYLCDPQQLNSDEREIRQAIQLCFRKVLLDNLGRKSSYAWLRKATVNKDGTVSYTDKEDIETVKAAVAKAKNIVLYIHGIIGETESMIPSVRYAKVNVKEQVKSLEELYDLVLAFDYESLNTPIEETARILKTQLAAVGLKPNHGKTLHIVAHSMGGLVSRSFIEQGNGNEVISHLIMVGTPNGGSPWATVHDLATTLLSFGFNFSYVPLVPSLLKKLVEAMSVTLREMHSTKSSFFAELKTSFSSRCPYSIIAGSTALINQASDAKQLLNALKNKLRRAIEFPFGDEENDIAVAVTSMIDVPQDGSSTVNILDTIACDHLSYFRQAEGLDAIASAIGQAFGYPPEPLPPSRSSSPSGPRPSPSPVSSGKTGAQPTGKSSTNTSTERAPGSSASTGAKSSVFANTLESQTPLSPAQKTATVSPQTNPNHETRTTKWFDTTHVVAIGINKYKNPIAKLKNAVSDAETICNLFSKSLLSREPVEHYKLLDEQATLCKICQKLKRLKNEVKESDRLILYFAGHGIALPMEVLQNPTADKSEVPPSNKPQGYLIPQDAEYDKVESYLSMSEFIKSLSDIQCRHCLIILDCCYAGAIRWCLGQDRQVSHKKVFPSVLDLYIDSPAWQILTSSAEDQTANDVLHHLQLKENNRDSNGKSNSPFVSFLEKGLNGEADHFPQDGIITINELITYLDAYVEKFTNEAQKRQTPQLCDFPPEKHKRGKFVFLLKEFAEVKKDLPPDPEISDKDNPYRGLQSYTENDDDLFFGRKKLIEKLSERIQNDLFTIVLGQSGAGKSSLVKAGLVPKLKGNSKKTELSQQSSSEEKTTKKSESKPKAPPVKWVAEIFRPGQLPATALEKALKKLELTNIPDNTKRLLVIDQFEEVETQCRDEKEKNNFWEKLIEQLKNSSNKLHLVFTLRSDFEPSLRSKFEDAIKKFDSENNIDWVSARFIVPNMEREELQDAIEKPAEKKAVFFTLDPNPDKEKPSSRTLVQQLVKEVEGMPGALPLLSFALYTMYSHFAQRYVKAQKKGDRLKREITWDDYRDSLDGEGVPGSLTKKATEEYEQLPTNAHRAMLRRVMLRMISLQGGELARRQVPKKELEYPDKEENDSVQTVIQRFSEARLIVEGSSSQGEPYLEPAHDALVKGWSKLQEWIDKEKENLLLQRRLVASTRDWSSQGCNQDSPLLWNQDIARIEKLKEIAKSDKYWLNELELRFFEASVKLRDQQEQGRLDTSLEIAITSSQRLFEAGKKFDALTTLIKTGKSLKDQLEKYESSRLYFLISFRDMFGELEPCKSTAAHEGEVTSIGFNSHKNIMASSDSKTIKLWNADGTIRQTLKRERGNEVLDLDFSRSGEFLAAADENGNIDLWQTSKNSTENTIEKDTFVFHKTFSRLTSANCIRFKPDDETLVSCDGSTVIIWKAEGSSIDPLKILGDSCSRSNDGSANCVAFSPDGGMIAVGYVNGVVKLWKSDGNKISTLKAAEASSVNSINFSYDGKTLVVGCENELQLWSIKEDSVEPKRTLFLNDNAQYVAFSPDDNLLASVDAKNTIILWLKSDKDWLNANTKPKKIRTLRHNKSITKICFLTNLDKTISITYNYGKTIQFWNCIDKFSGYCQEDKKFYGHTNRIVSIALSGDGKTVVTVSLDRTIKVWSNSGFLLETLYSDKQGYNPGGRVKISRDGQTIVAVLKLGKVIVWRKKDNLRYDRISEEEEFISEFDVSHNGDFYLTVNRDNTVMKVFSLCGNKHQLILEEGNRIKMNFDSSGEVITSVNVDKIVNIWNVKNGVFLKAKIDFGNNVQYAKFFHNNSLFPADYRRDHKHWVVTIDGTSELNIWSVNRELEQKELERPIKRDIEAKIIDLQFTGKTIVVLSESSFGKFYVELYSLSGTSTKMIPLAPGSLTTISLTMDCNVIVVADFAVEDYENRIRLWNLDLANLEQMLTTLQSGIRSKLEIINEQIM